MNAPTPPALDITGLSCAFDGRAALSDVDLQVEPGEMVALIGPSGSGKSTLLRHISGLTSGRGSSGTVRVHGDVVQQDGRLEPQVRRLRADIGFVFQQFQLVGRLRLLDNVLVGLLPRVPVWRGLVGLFTRSEKERALSALHRVGLAAAALQRTSTLSGGQQQRAAIARAMVQQARVILADEPIASLDPASARQVMADLKRVNGDSGVTVVVSLHQVPFAVDFCQRAVALRDGQVVYDGPADGLTPSRLQAIYGDRLAHELEEGHETTSLNEETT
jgi:phosphonate transport system ATP-binding protein